MGLSGAAARTVNDDRDAALPAPRKEVRAPASPLLGSAATVAAEEEETNAIVPAVRSPECRARVVVGVELSVWCARQFMVIKARGAGWPWLIPEEIASAAVACHAAGRIRIPGSRVPGPC
jgi:hypothetical protein